MNKSSYPRPHSLLRGVLFAALVSGLAALSASAQTYPSARPPKAPSDPRIDDTTTPAQLNENLTTGTKSMQADHHTEKVISKVSELSSEQLRLAQIATQRATDAQVRSLAGQVESCNQDLQQAFDQIAQKNSVLVPTGKAGNDVADRDQQWENKDGKQFDQDYVKRVIKDTKDTIEALEDYRKVQDPNPDITALADKLLPSLRENLSQAEALKKQVD